MLSELTLSALPILLAKLTGKARANPFSGSSCRRRGGPG